MPLPLAHTAAGVACYLAASRTAGAQRGTRRNRWIVLSACILAANAPDLDLLPGLLVGLPNRFHHGASHSLLVAVALGVVVGAAVHFVIGTRGTRIYLSCVAATISHPMLDALSDDTSRPFGVPLLWPIQSTYYISSFPVFLGVPRASHGSLNFFASLVSLDVAKGLFIELLLVGIGASLWSGLTSQRRISDRVLLLLVAAVLGVLYYSFHGQQAALP